ncbi:uncharacterized protein LOC119093914 [Pollicipes pollicipes]|uniref:uncharacterized protein LOC119093914 n=1 Tax=Pollicipes pollicipes TaxID=41117 RepID=UPI001884A909|nr:uncharacterized protein LOC119093914 [Pollicipes pollicipes]
MRPPGVAAISTAEYRPLVLVMAGLSLLLLFVVLVAVLCTYRKRREGDEKSAVALAGSKNGAAMRPASRRHSTASEGRNQQVSPWRRCHSSTELSAEAPAAALPSAASVQQLDSLLHSLGADSSARPAAGPTSIPKMLSQ